METGEEPNQPFHRASNQRDEVLPIETVAEGKILGRYYSSVEDFRRDRISTTRVRRARFGNGWVQSAEGSWSALARARFTGDPNPATNIDAGPEGSLFLLATGGSTTNTTAKLNSTFGPEPLAQKQRPPQDLPQEAKLAPHP